MGIVETGLLAHECIYWINICADIENTVNNCSTHFDFQQNQPKERIIQHETMGKPYEIFEVDMVSLYNKQYFCIVFSVQ